MREDSCVSKLINFLDKEGVLFLKRKIKHLFLKLPTLPPNKMNKKSKLIILVGILFIISMYSININDTYAHENVHKQIAAYNIGCSEGYIKVNWFSASGYFNCTKSMNVPDEWKQQRVYLDSMNEIVGYNVTTIINTMLIIGFLMAITIILVGKDD